jgi:hypothetical protein
VRPRPRHLSYPALLAALLSLVLAIATAAETLAHHPGSHAAREGDGRVRLDVATAVPDACTTIAAVEKGAPPSVQPPRGAEPVTVRLERPAGLACATVVTAVRREAVLEIPPDIATLHLFIVGPEGVRATERVPIR